MVSYIGYKGFDKDLKCHKGFQYEIGKIYEMDENPEICTRGYHYCNNLRDVFKYMGSDCRICIVKTYGNIDVDSDYSKSCTNKIEILKEINISKEDRIRYVYANWYALSDAKLRDILNEEFILDQYINDCWIVREAIAEQRYSLDKLINDESWEVRDAVANQGYGLDILINDEDPDVRLAVAKQGYGLNKLIDDPYWIVRVAVAKQGYSLDKLVNDPDWRVRKAVAEQGYGLEKLIKDKHPTVRYVARTKLYEK